MEKMVKLRKKNYIFECDSPIDLVSRVALPFSTPYLVCQLTVIPCHHPTMGTDPCPTGELGEKKKSRMRNCSEMTSNASRKSASGCIFLCVLLSWGTITSHTLRDSPGGFRASVDLKKPSRLLRTQWAHHPGEKAEQTRTQRPGGPLPPIRQY